MGAHIRCDRFKALVIQRLNQFLIGFIVFFVIGDKHFIDFEFGDNYRRAADMIGIGVGENQIVQAFYLLFVQVVLNQGSLGIFSGINQHGMSVAGDQGGVSLPHIQEMHFHRAGIGRQGFHRPGRNTSCQDSRN